MSRFSFDYPGCYLAQRSPVHAMPAWLKLMITVALAVTATQARQWPIVTGVLILELVLYLLARIDIRRIWRDFRIVMVQLPLVMGLYVLRDGESGYLHGAVIAAQIGATLLPAFWLQRCTRLDELIQCFNRVLPRRLGFVLFASLRFLPLLLRDAREIIALQTLRGARIHGRHLLNPRNWPELARCVAIPVMVRAAKLAGEVATAAHSRGIAEADSRDLLRATGNALSARRRTARRSPD